MYEWFIIIDDKNSWIETKTKIESISGHKGHINVFALFPFISKILLYKKNQMDVFHRVIGERFFSFKLFRIFISSTNQWSLVTVVGWIELLHGRLNFY